MKRAVAALLLLAACSPSSDRASEPEPTPSPSRAFVDGEPCPRIGTDPTVLQGCLTGARGDLDGDGRDDVASLYAELGANDMPVAWWLTVELSTDRPLDTSVRIRPGDAYPRLLGAGDRDDDGRAELFVGTRTNGSTELLGVFGVSDEGLFRYDEAR